MRIRITAVRALVVGLLAVAVLPLGMGGAAAQEAPGKAVIVSLPTLRWSDVVDHRPQAILDIVEQSAAASTSVRTIGAKSSIGESYVTIGAGNRSTVDDLLAGRAYGPEHKVQGVPAGETYTNRTGYDVAGSSVVHLGLASVRKAAQTLNYDADPGAFGTAMAQEGMSTAVVANADVQRAAHREAALAMMDVEGRVAGGSVSKEALVPDLGAPFGSQVDVGASVAAAEDALREHDAVLVEASDLARIDFNRKLMTIDAYKGARADAIEAADELVAQLVSSLDLDRDLLILVAPNSPFDEPAELTMFAMTGPDIEPGIARGSTRRDGYVTLTDIAPTLLDYFGIDKPDVMTGNIITSQGGGPVTLDEVDGFVGANESATFRDRVMGAVTITYILLQVAVYVLAIYAFTRASRPRWRAIAAGCALWLMSIPLTAFLLGLVRFDKLGLAGFGTALIAGAGIIAALAWLAFRRVGAASRIGPPIAIAGLTLLVLLVDAITGASLQIDTIFGYSPTVAGRFAGYGNLAFGILAICAVTAAAGVWALPRMRGNGASMPRVGWPWWTALGLLLVTLVVNGYPSWGSDVGGVLATTPSYAALLILLAGWELGWKRIFMLGLSAVAALGLFAVIDLSRPATERTHLARFVESIGDGGALTIIGRKIEANIGILTSSMWAWLVPIGLVFLIMLIRRDPTFIATLRRRVPGFQEWLVGAFMVAILGMAVNDSGVAVPAAMLGIALPYLIYAGAMTEAAEDAAAGQRHTAELVGDH